MNHERFTNNSGNDPEVFRPSRTRAEQGAGSREVGGGIGEELFQDQSCYLTVGALCSCDADPHPAVSYAFLGLEPIA